MLSVRTITACVVILICSRANAEEKPALSAGEFLEGSKNKLGAYTFGYVGGFKALTPKTAADYAYLAYWAGYQENKDAIKILADAPQKLPTYEALVAELKVRAEKEVEEKYKTKGVWESWSNHDGDHSFFLTFSILDVKETVTLHYHVACVKRNDIVTVRAAILWGHGDYELFAKGNETMAPPGMKKDEPQSDKKDAESKKESEP
jgi:hypothetical protein